MDQSPRSAALNKGRGKGQRRPRKSKSASGQIPGGTMGMGQSPLAQTQPGMAMQGVQGPTPQVPHISAYSQAAGAMQQTQQFSATPSQQQWYNQQQQQQQQQQPQGYYPQQMANSMHNSFVIVSLYIYNCV